MEEIHIFMASNDVYVPYLSTTILSIVSHTREKCYFHIFDGGIEKDNKKKIKFISDTFSNCEVLFIPVNYDLFKGFPIIKHFSINTYFRYLIADTLPSLNKALWLDCDMLVMGDIRSLWDIDLGNKCLGAVPYLHEDKKYRKSSLYKGTLKLKEKLGLPLDHSYFNAGLLLLNLEYWRKNNWTEKLFTLTNEKKNVIECPDQDILNILSENDYVVLPDTFNSIVDINLILGKRLYQIPTIIHFTGGNKIRPWIARNCPYLDLYYQHALKTPFKDFFIQKRKELVFVKLEKETFFNKLKRQIRRFIFQKKITKSGRVSVKVFKIPLPINLLKKILSKGNKHAG